MDHSGNRSYGKSTPRKASSKGDTGGRQARPKGGKSPSRKNPKNQY